jgi:AraC-like DNA-binding protein
MDNTDNLRRLVRRFAVLAPTGEPPVVYAAMSRIRSATPPRPLVGFMFMAQGAFSHWHVGGRRVEVPEGHVGAMNAHFGTVSAPPTEAVRLWSVAFDVSGNAACTDLEASPFFLTAPVRRPERIETAYERVAMHLGSESEPTRMRFHAALLELFATILEETGAGASGPRPVEVERALAAIRARYADASLALDGLAEAAMVSPRHLRRLFREHVGASPMQALERFRMERASERLRHTDLQVREVARETGFADPLYFSRAFRRRMGCSPSAFRHWKQPHQEF